MKAWEQKIVPFGFGLAVLLFFAAALKPVFSGRPLNTAFLAIGALFLILAVAIARKKPVQPPNPPGA